jgi:probable F420-dependent oxidoreductase
MKFGLSFASSAAYDADTSLELCRKAESLGFDSVWAAEHVVRPTRIESAYPYTADGVMPGETDSPIPDPLIWLAYVASEVPAMKLGTCILILPQRNPLILAKELGTLDHLSGGRVELGIGVGWMKEEFDALGVEWSHRGARTNEYIEALRTLWSGPEVEFHGRFVDFPKVTVNPRPPNGSIPIIVGGDSPAAVRRAGQLADGYYPGTADLTELRRLISGVREEAARAGRSPDDIQINVHPQIGLDDPAGELERYQELGVSRIMVPAFVAMGPGGFDNIEALTRKFGIDDQA